MKTIQEYMKLYKKIAAEEEKESAVRVAFLSSFTIKGLKEILTVEAMEEGIHIATYEGEYDQIPQEILGEQSGLKQFAPHIIYVLWDAKSILGDFFFDAYAMEEVERRQFVEEKLGELKGWLELMADKLSALVVWNNLCLPDYSPLGVLDTKQSFGLTEAVEYVNAGLREYLREKDNFYLYDFNRFCARVGYENIQDDKMYYFGDMLLSMERMPALACEYMSYLRAYKAKNKKCLVLDLDNTLWGGIVGEDGLEGIRLGLHYTGKPYYEFQKYILSLYHKGVILAINSKNNEADALEVLRKHKYMVLREEMFAAMRINWQDKATNLRELAAELNIGLDSMVFLDDDAANCELVRQELPEVLTLQMPDKPEKNVSFFKTLHVFDGLQFTREDRNKNAMYAAQKQRRELEQGALNLEDYIKRLEIKTVYYPMADINIQRMAQLTQKTNQFNLTTKRYVEADLRSLREKGYELECVEVSDKYGDNGISGVLIYYYDGETETVKVDTMLLSCRVMGRNVENTFLERLESYARKKGARWLEGEYRATAKNKPVADLYERFGFTLTASKEQEGFAVQTWKKQM